MPEQDARRSSARSGARRSAPPPSRSIRAKISSASASISSVSASTYHEPPSGIGHVDHAGLLGQHLLGAQGDLRRLLRRQGQGLVERVGVQRVGAAEHGGQRLDGGPHHVVVGLLRGQRHPGGLGVEAQRLRLGRGRAVPVPQPARPDPPRRPELGDLLEEVDVGVEEEAQPRREPVDVQPARQAELDVAEPVGQRERQLLRGGRAGLADVVAGDAERLVRRDRGRCSTPSGHRSAAGAAPARTATPSGRCTP